MRDSVDQKGVVDSLLARLRSDTLVADTITPVQIREFEPPSAVFDSIENAHDRIRAVPSWPLPHPADFAAGDLADWLVFHPAFDVDDGPGPGQSRLYTHWGLIERRSSWDVDGRRLSWQRLQFPQTAQFDPVVIPSFDFDSIEAGDELRLRRGSDWPYHARSSYFLRQGDFGETYSQGDFRRLFAKGYGIDLGFAFYESKGRYPSDNRDNRYVRLHLVGPLKDKTFWNVYFYQFRDKTTILPDSTYVNLRPLRDDLMYVLESSVYYPPDSSDSSTGWSAGLTLESAKHDIREWTINYQLETHAKTWTAWGRRVVRGWLFHAAAIWNGLDFGRDGPSRWGLSLSGERTMALGRLGSGFLKWTGSDWDTDPFALEFTAAATVSDRARALVPTLRLQRLRIVPSLFDRSQQLRTAFVFENQSPFIDRYSESGDSKLQAEWRNEASVVFETPRNSAGTVDLSFEGYVAYVQRYTRWLDVSDVVDTVFFQPRSNDARAIGFAVGLHTPLFWKFESWFNYAAKYAETLDHARIPDYYPHKASAVFSWIAPRFRYNIDVRINSALIWWYGDRRNHPTPYVSTPHVVRWDLSASARMKTFTFYYSLQNVANFPYRTRAGQFFTGRQVRFGLYWRFVD